MKVLTVGLSSWGNLCFLTAGGVILSCACQSEYQRGVSAWKFDIEDLKAQASLVGHIFNFNL